jgi:branched-chain amino acid transport system permease protein
VRVIANNLDVTGGAEGMSGLPQDANTLAIYASLAVVALVLFLGSRARNSRSPSRWCAKTSTRRAASASTSATVRTISLAIGGAIAGLGGALYAHANFFITPADFGFPQMEQILVACVVGGVTSSLGAAVGALLMTILPELVRFLHDYREVSTGTILLGIILFAPGGIAGLWQRRT